MHPTAATLQQPIRPAATMRSAGWVVRRALLGIFALSVIVMSGALLLYASIEPDAAAAATDQSQSE